MRKPLKVIATLLGTQAMIDSGYDVKQAKNFGREHNLKADLKRWDSYNPTYYIAEANPELNYGLDFTIWAKYVADGITFLKQIDFGGGGCIDSGGLQRAFIGENEITFGTEFYDKGQKNRQALRKHSVAFGWVFC